MFFEFRILENFFIIQIKPALLSHSIDNSEALSFLFLVGTDGLLLQKIYSTSPLGEPITS
jgi:hypothetical protein